MSYAAEPYAQFVDDLLLSLTGGVARERFTFLPEAAPFQLRPDGALVPGTLAVYGLVDGAYARFQVGRDVVLNPDYTLAWRSQPDGSRAPDAVWPDEGSTFFANYDAVGGLGGAPLLNDRNVGSVTRLLSESFAREFAVLSRQLASVYAAAYLDTAEGRDLDQVVALVGVQRRTRSFAGGSVVFAANAPATGDVAINAGTQLSTTQPPPVVFETSEDRALRRGELTVEVPVRATVAGGAGVVPARAIGVIHRPILGIASVSNAQPTTLAGEDESDEALRLRARRALEGAGRATPGALVAALTTLPPIREQFVRIEEQHLLRPGVVIVNVAAELSPADAARAVQLLDATRPVGVRVLDNLDPAPALIPGVPPNERADPLGGDTPEILTDPLYQPVRVRALLLPASPAMSATDRAALQARARSALAALVADAGIGQTLIYNRLVSALMALEGVLDVALELYAKPAPGKPPGPQHQNLSPASTRRPKLAEEDLSVEIASEIVAFDVTVTVTLSDTALETSTEEDALADTRSEVAGLLQDAIEALPGGSITRSGLQEKLPPTPVYTVEALHYTASYREAGLQVNVKDADILLGELERPWIRNVKVQLPAEAAA